jgi:hypothetical protein
VFFLEGKSKQSQSQSICLEIKLLTHVNFMQHETVHENLQENMTLYASQVSNINILMIISHAQTYYFPANNNTGMIC